MYGSIIFITRFIVYKSNRYDGPTYTTTKQQNVFSRRLCHVVNKYSRFYKLLLNNYSRYDFITTHISPLGSHSTVLSVYPPRLTLRKRISC